MPGVDLIAYGHSHKEMADTTINGVLLMQAKNWVQSVAVAQPARSCATAWRWRVASKSSRLCAPPATPSRRPCSQATEPAHGATVAWVTTPIGRTDVAWRADSARVVDTPLLDFVLEVQRRAANADLAAAAAFSLDAIDRFGRDHGGARCRRSIRTTTPCARSASADAQLREYLEFSARYYRHRRERARVASTRRCPGFNFDVVAGADYVLDLSRPRASA